MKTNKYILESTRFLLSNFDILFFSGFIILIFLAIVTKNDWFFTISYIVATLGYSASFYPTFKRKKEDERDSFLYYRANTYAFISTLIFLVTYLLFQRIIFTSWNINSQKLLSIVLCFAISSYNLFYIFLKRKY